jgi:hypothetical protein
MIFSDPGPTFHLVSDSDPALAPVRILHEFFSNILNINLHSRLVSVLGCIL